MKFVKTPNLPEAGKLALIDYRIEGQLLKELEKRNIDCLRVNAHEDLYKSVSGHPDMQLHHLGGKDMVYAPGVSTELIKKLETLGYKMIIGSSKMRNTYPYSVAYNVARIGDFVLHNFEYTDEVLLAEFEKRGLKRIKVKQGYAKCSVCIVNKNSIITADLGIARAAREFGIEVLLIPPQRNIVLKGLDYGFIGGSGGLISSKSLAFFGDATLLESYRDILTFTEERGVEVVSLSNERVQDFGSILVIAQ